jgi:hypothetical protein
MRSLRSVKTRNCHVYLLLTWPVCCQLLADSLDEFPTTPMLNQDSYPLRFLGRTLSSQVTLNEYPIGTRGWIIGLHNLFDVAPTKW